MIIKALGGNLPPISPIRVSERRIGFHLSLALHAGGAIGQDVQASHRDLGLTKLTASIGALFDPSQSAFDLTQLAGLQLGQLRRNFLAARIKSGVSCVAGFGGLKSSVRKLACQDLTQGRATGYQ